jgi:hypothetical protein
MAALLRFALPLFLVAGCLNGDFNAPDQAVPAPDMAGPPKVYDLAGVDLYGAYNCSALNMCERICTTKACILMCRKMATPTAVDLQIALQNCFVQYCPNDPGKVCEPDAMGMLSMACNTCINNTYLPQSASCSPSQQVDECHMCLMQANACTADM